MITDLQLFKKSPHRVHTGLGTAFQLGFPEEKSNALGENDVFIHVDNSVFVRCFGTKAYPSWVAFILHLLV